MENNAEKRLTKKMKILLASLSVIIVLLSAVTIITQIASLDNPQNVGSVVYRSEGKTIVRINGKERQLTDISAANFRCDNENERIFFTVDSSRYDGLYDLCYVQKNRSVLSDSKIIDVGVEKNFTVVSGNVYYLKKNTSAGANDGCVCDIDNGTIETFSANVESIYALDGSEKLYFTKMHGANKVLYFYENETPKEVCRDVVNVFCYNNTDKPHIIFERKSQINDGMTELYISYYDSEPEMICDNTYLVMFDDYSAGGNLYYFTSSDKSVSWSAVISDEYAEADKDLTKPVKNSILSIFGLSAEYNKALRLYQDKLLRDEIRAALNESVDKGDFSAPVFSAFAYNSEGVFKIAENIDPDNVCSVSDFGDPKIIFESTELNINQADMATLVEIARRETMSEVISYAVSLINDSVKSLGMAFAGWCDSGSFVYELQGYDKKKTLFSFSENGSKIFAFVRDSNGERLSLYSNNIDEKLMPSVSVNVDNGISGYRILNDSVIYLKTDVGNNIGDLYSYNGEKSEKLSDDVSAFLTENSEDIIIIKGNNLSDSNPTADYYVFNGEDEILIDQNIIVSTFVVTDEGKAAYINGDGQMKVYYKGESFTVSENTDEILLFK